MFHLVAVIGNKNSYTPLFHVYSHPRTSVAHQLMLTHLFFLYQQGQDFALCPTFLSKNIS